MRKKVKVSQAIELDADIKCYFTVPSQPRKSNNYHEQLPYFVG